MLTDSQRKELDEQMRSIRDTKRPLKQRSLDSMIQKTSLNGELLWFKGLGHGFGGIIFCFDQVSGAVSGVFDINKVENNHHFNVWSLNRK